MSILFAKPLMTHDGVSIIYQLLLEPRAIPEWRQIALKSQVLALPCYKALIYEVERSHQWNGLPADRYHELCKEVGRSLWWKMLDEFSFRESVVTLEEWICEHDQIQIILRLPPCLMELPWELLYYDDTKNQENDQEVTSHKLKARRPLRGFLAVNMTMIRIVTGRATGELKKGRKTVIASPRSAGLKLQFSNPRDNIKFKIVDPPVTWKILRRSLTDRRTAGFFLVSKAQSDTSVVLDSVDRHSDLLSLVDKSSIDSGRVIDACAENSKLSFAVVLVCKHSWAAEKLCSQNNIVATIGIQGIIYQGAATQLTKHMLSAMEEGLSVANAVDNYRKSIFPTTEVLTLDPFGDWRGWWLPCFFARNPNLRFDSLLPIGGVSLFSKLKYSIRSLTS